MIEKMNCFRVVEHFVSINGEGRRAGQLALFIRFAGCNLNCVYCDTKWANEEDVPYESYTSEQLYNLIKDSKVSNVTLTGGEPLLQKKILELLQLLRQDDTLRVEIETNGSVDVKPFMKDGENDNITFTLDYKTAVSGMEERMFLDNYVNLRKEDTVKFVVGSRHDIEKAGMIIDRYHLIKKGCGIYISPCFGMIEPREIVDYLVDHRWNDVNVQLQLHKFIWDPEQRGV